MPVVVTLICAASSSFPYLQLGTALLDSTHIYNSSETIANRTHFINQSIRAHILQQTTIDTFSNRRGQKSEASAKNNLLQMEQCNSPVIAHDALQNIDLLKSHGGSLPRVTTLGDLIAELRKVFDGDDVNVEYVDYLMRSYKSNPAEWKKYAKFDRYKYTRNLVDTGNGKYNLMLICWGEGHGSAIHDHADAHCFMKMLEGSLQEIRFAWPQAENEELVEISRTILPPNGVCYMNDALGLHRVENNSHVEPAVSLHLYCPPYNKCAVFNQNTGQKTMSQVTFWSMYGERRGKNTSDPREPEDN